MNKTKILITCGTHPFSQRVASILQGRGMDTIFVSSEEIPFILLQNGRYFKIPPATDHIFVHELLKVALDQQVDAILPLSIQEVQRLSLEAKLFEEYGMTIHLPAPDDFETVEVMINPPRALELAWTDAGFFAENDDRQVFLCLAE